MTRTGPVAVLEPMTADMQSFVRKICPGLDMRFPRSGHPDDFADIVVDAPYIVTRGLRFPASVLEQARAVRLIHQWGTGTDGIPLVEARARGITVARSPGVNAPTVADMTIGLMLATLRRIPQVHASMRTGQWEMKDLWQRTFDLSSATVGLIGLGAIGQQVAARLQGFGCEIVYTKPSGPVAGSSLRFADMDALLAQCDVISLHLPLTADTHHLLGPDCLALMKPGSVLINTSRGALVDETALVAALESAHLAGAGLDVFEKEPVAADNPLLALDSVVTLPHVSGLTRDNLVRMVSHWAANITAFDQGQPIDPACLVR
ncbi:2-hydroxyacid dehydrogenase [Halomonas sp. TRM85114]|uniref:2-hydroxyacid dehydrogenase n=1 Tax=Halomonas jincaotanensis TaxID=2810616 RepID=UPI001BD49725|nr:2-hydroxyacid dehydrogenase [Halomonas jincaotanensis]MBS9404379.1 2-hydroxyacid dehydrogenase [Halomonas jincaotanensis]